jgi:cell division protein FtsW
MIKHSKFNRLDWPLAAIYGLLASFGLLMILSASSLEADAKYGDSLRFVVRQAAGITVGLSITLGILVTPMRWLQRAGWPVFIASLLSLLMSHTPLAHPTNGATR